MRAAHYFIFITLCVLSYGEDSPYSVKSKKPGKVGYIDDVLRDIIRSPLKWVYFLAVIITLIVSRQMSVKIALVSILVATSMTYISIIPN